MADAGWVPVRKTRAKRAKQANRAKPSDTLDATEIAMKAAAAGADGDSPARAVLEKHSRLIDAQRRLLRLQVATRLSFLFAALAIVASVGALMWDASGSRDIVVEGFRVPELLEARGLSGEVIASKILDRLTDMRGQTRTTRAVDALESGWREEYRVGIPQTGTSIGEVRTALRRWLGDDTLIGGEIYLTASEMALTVRTNRGGSATFRGAEAELDRLAGLAAEHVYRQTDPFLYGIFLQQSGQIEHAIEVLRTAADADLDAEERAWALSGLGSIYNEQGRCAEAIPVLRRANRLDPRLPNAISNVGQAYACVGEAQRAFDHRRRALEIVRSGNASGQDPRSLFRDWRGEEVRLAQELGDYGRQLRILQQTGLEGPEDFLWQAFALANLRDVSGSIRLLAQFRPVTETDRRYYWINRAQQAAVLEDWAEAAERHRRAVLACERIGPSCAITDRFGMYPMQAVLLARAGDAAAAGAIVRRMPGDCYTCAWARAVVAEARGDRPAADAWFEQAVRLAPRLPEALVEWGKARIGRRDFAGGLSLFERALRLAPEHLEAHQGRADALAGLTRHREALRAYARAAGRAPRWGALHINWGLSLREMGRRDEARAKWRAAAGMDLGRRDRARLRHVSGIANRSAP